MILSHGIEISIAGGGGEMVHVPISWSVFFFFFCNHVFIVLRYKKLHAALAMAKTKAINNPTSRFTSSWEKSNTSSL